jgi:hypothetical protein
MKVLSSRQNIQYTCICKNIEQMQVLSIEYRIFISQKYRAGKSTFYKEYRIFVCQKYRAGKSTFYRIQNLHLSKIQSRCKYCL